MSAQSNRDTVSGLLGREVVVDKLQRKGGFVVRYLNYSASAPPVGKTEEEALELFIPWFEELKRSGGLGDTLPPEEVS